MSRVVPSSTQKSAAEKMITAVGRIKGCDAELVESSRGTKSRWTVSIVCDPANWSRLAVEHGNPLQHAHKSFS